MGQRQFLELPLLFHAQGARLTRVVPFSALVSAALHNRILTIDASAMGKYSQTPASDLCAPWLDLLSGQIQMRNSTDADTSFIAALSERGLTLVENRKGHPELSWI